ncbi:unnamed protein product [Prunus armeniaca]
MFRFGGEEVRTPIFYGENYEFWRIKMTTIFKSLGLWMKLRNYPWDRGILVIFLSGRNLGIPVVPLRRAR